MKNEKWEPSIPVKVVDIHLRSVEQMLAALIKNDHVPFRLFTILESRTRFLRELVDELQCKVGSR